MAGFAVGAERSEDLAYLAELADTGEFNPVIDRIFSLNEIRDAHRLVESRHKRGNVIVSIRE